ncbi:hypothetical protein [Pseudomonas sp. MBLB4136]|uniref:hypothetical protein n=1 Tax=Pseudomonas sp. MBLB4136 TaxID=3451558 RepID=UPI003F74AEE1
MINGLATLQPSSAAGRNLPAVSSEAQVRGYVDFQLLLSKLLPQQPVATADGASDAAPEPAPLPAPAQEAVDADYADYLARLTLEHGEYLRARPQPVDHLSLVLLADASNACARLTAPGAVLGLPPPPR